MNTHSAVPANPAAFPERMSVWNHPVQIQPNNFVYKSLSN